jgi:hypothetical protein
MVCAKINVCQCSEIISTILLDRTLIKWYLIIFLINLKILKKYIKQQNIEK